jgi:steroid 5-alpha reductase family enzyme
MGNVFFHAARSATLAFVLVCVSGMVLADWQGAVWHSSPKQAGKDFRIRHRAATRLKKQTGSVKLKLSSIITEWVIWRSTRGPYYLGMANSAKFGCLLKRLCGAIS